MAWKAAGKYVDIRSRLVALGAATLFLLGVLGVAVRFYITHGFGDFIAVILAGLNFAGACLMIYVHDGLRSRVKRLIGGRVVLLNELAIEGQGLRKSIFGITRNPELEASEQAVAEWSQRTQDFLTERFPKRAGRFGQTPLGHIEHFTGAREPLNRPLSLMDNRLHMLDEIIKES